MQSRVRRIFFGDTRVHSVEFDGFGQGVSLVEYGQAPLSVVEASLLGFPKFPGTILGVPLIRKDRRI